MQFLKATEFVAFLKDEVPGQPHQEVSAEDIVHHLDPMPLLSQQVLLKILVFVEDHLAHQESNQTASNHLHKAFSFSFKVRKDGSH